MSMSPLNTLLAAMIVAVATLVTADDLATTTRWPSSVQFDALHWWRNVTFDKCSPGGDCEGEGQLCNDYPPCTRGWCDECDEDYVAYITPSLHFTCIKSVKVIGDNCTSDQECPGAVSTCEKQVCTCPPALIATFDGTDCVLANLPLTLGLPCVSSGQCGENAQCGKFRNGGRCSCYDNHKPATNGYDCLPFHPNDRCNVTSCPTPASCPGATCRSPTNIYACLPGFRWSETDHLGHLCVPDAVTFNVALGKTCSYEAPYLSICSNGLQCDFCPENDQGPVCIDEYSFNTGARSIACVQLSTIAFVLFQFLRS